MISIFFIKIAKLCKKRFRQAGELQGLSAFQLFQQYDSSFLEELLLEMDDRWTGTVIIRGKHGVVKKMVIILLIS
ncbi:MAG: hypothetical protein IJE05_03350 [Clostridia bacterium]|nr:hypothetical protein [Clostridia bacterium]